MDVLLNSIVDFTSIVWKYDNDQSRSLLELLLAFVDHVLEMLIVDKKMKLLRTMPSSELTLSMGP